MEQAIRTFLLLPRRLTGLRTSQRKIADSGESFPALIDALEDAAPEFCTDLDLGAIHWLHNLRNELYHQGIGMTIRRENLEVYATHASLLLERLFGVRLSPTCVGAAEQIGRIIVLANRLASALRYAASDHVLVAPRRVADAMTVLKDVLRHEEIQLIRDFLRVRHKLAHAEARIEDIAVEADIGQIEKLVTEFETMQDLNPGHELHHGL